MRKVLVVDDNRINRQILSGMLCDEYELCEAKDGAQALELLHGAYCDASAILLDILMPVMDGFETLTAIRADSKLRELPVIIITGSEEPGTEARALRLGANDFVTKPYEREIIRRRLYNAISLRESADAARAAQLDELTGLYNRSGFFKKATEMISEQEPGFYVMTCFDVNSFKVINDQYGVARGDDVLRHIADTFRKGFEPEGGICCRMNSDRFAVLYPHSFMDSEKLAEIRRCAASPTFATIPIDFSIGRYIVSDPAVSVGAMYDRAMLAKASVKGRYDTKIALYDEPMRNFLLHQQQIVTDMKGALLSGQFVVWLQPQYNHASGALVGAEALVRWRRPDGSFLPPDEFIPIFERNGFIYEMDKYVWEQVCMLLRRWLDEGRHPTPVSVNVSRFDLLQEDFSSVITGLLEKHGVPVYLLRLEITETAFSKATDKLIDMVSRLTAYGFVVEVDDFGSGYSSLNTLKDVPATVLKIDMRFLEKTENSQRSGNILESIVRMASWLGMSVIAEGVETIQQADFLRSIGCYYVQGYLYARPMPVSEYEALASGSGKEPEMMSLETVKTLDNDTFWDPDSMETLIFNSYVGAACIFELHDGNVEILRINEKYATELLGEGAGVEQAFAVVLADYADDENRNTLRFNVIRAAESNVESTCEICLHDLPGKSGLTYLRVSERVIARVGERMLVYCTFIDVTAQRESEKQLRFLNDMSRELLSQADIETAIDHALKRLLDYFCGNRIYVFEINYEKQILDNTYEICARGIRSEKSNLQAMPFEMMRLWLDTFERRSFISIENVELLGAERAREREILMAQGISSLLAVPLRRDDRLIGFIGVDDPRRQQSYIDRLSAIGDYIAVMLTRRDYELRLASGSKELEQMMQDMPGGYAKMLITPSGIVPLFINGEFCRICGIDHSDALKMYENNAFAGVHPDDLESVQAIIGEAVANRTTVTLRVRLQTGQGEYVTMLAFYRITEDDAGNMYLNGYYSDATAQLKAEAQRDELLENLPCGAGTYEIRDGKIHVTYLNKRYRQYLNREIDDLGKVDVYDSLHPEDVETLNSALQASLASGDDVVCDIRIKDGIGGYIPFHLKGVVMERGESCVTVYVTYMPVSPEAASFSEMLPVALAAMMASSTDLSFVKDRDLRYICCSSAFAKMVGLSSEKEIAGKTDFDIFEPVFAEAYMADDRRLMESGTSIIDMIEDIPGEDGRIRYSNTSKYLLYDSCGNVLGLYGTGRDVTEAREADSQLRLLTESIPGGLATYEFGSDGLRLLYFNDGFCRLFGYDRLEYSEASMRDPLSRIFEEDRPAVLEQINALITDGTPMKCIYRAHVKGGGYKWISHRGGLADRRGNTTIINAALFDVTEQQEATERLRISEEENRIAIRHSGSSISRFTLADRTSTLPAEVAAALCMPEKMTDVPYAQANSGLLAPESVDTYIGFYEAIMRGEAEGTATFREKFTGSWRWMEAYFSTVFSSSGKPVSALVAFSDVTDRVEKEAVYKKWQQSLKEKGDEAYTLMRCNLSKNTAFDSIEGSLLHIDRAECFMNFDENMLEYARQHVYDEDRARFIAFLSSDTLLSRYYRDKSSDILEYREWLPDGNTRWMRLTVDLLEYPNSTDVEAYLMYENIDDSKRAELLTLERAETDPLTGIMNRVAFTTQIEKLIAQSKPSARHALLMLDIDGFKMVNDVFGHSAGDQVLIEVAESLRACLRRGDLLCRLGGDEFIVFLRDIPSDNIAENKARQICALVRKSFSLDVQISGSVGIAICPRDGTTFDTLYRKVDAALYRVKDSGKNSYVFYNDSMNDKQSKTLVAKAGSIAKKSGKKNRMLIVDDSKIDHMLLTHMFNDEFTVEKARDGNSALMRLRHYGTAISIVLLDLMMPGTDGFAVLESMQSSEELRSIPVIVVSASDDREVGLRAIRCGASDFVTKPVDSALLHIRVQSAISKAENERLRAQNSFLQMRSAEILRYKTVLEREGTVVIEYDWVTDTFIYDPCISEHIAGTYDERKLWHILLSDMVAEVSTVKEIQEFVFEFARDRQRMDDRLEVRLKTPSKAVHRFRLCLHKQADEFRLTSKLLFALSDMDVRIKHRPPEALA